MRNPMKWVFFSGTAIVLIAGLSFVGGSPQEDASTAPGLGDPKIVAAAYDQWATKHQSLGGDRNVVVGLGWSKGLSTQFTRGRGLAKLDLVDGSARVELTDLRGNEPVDVWLVDNRPGPGRSVLPEWGDEMMRLGRIDPVDGVGELETDLDPKTLESFELDVVVVSSACENPAESRILTGAPTLFQRIYTRTHRQPTSTWADESSPSMLSSTGFWDTLARRVGAKPAFAQVAGDGLDASVDRGRNLFFNETFNGNGRTCGTCHPAANSLTIDPLFIATLPPTDPLFVAETNRNLAQNFENPTLMRKVGLILENVDGFGDLPNKFVMRGVPHTLALPTSLTAVVGGGDGTTIPPNQRTGWGGDGAPGSGTLREFAIGAVTQHFTLTLNRVPGVDFRLPNDAELDAMAAFQLSLGRQADIDLRAMVFTSEVVARGQAIFNNGGPFTVPGVAQGKCFFCHNNAGANDFFLNNQNANFNTNVEGLPDQPADLIDPTHNPPDGGFGTAPSSFGFGNGSFNTPPLIEAADTGPFFHNNAIQTIEEAVNFYNSAAFNNPPGFGSVIGGITLQATEVVAVAALLRVLNAVENIDEADAEEKIAANSTLARGRPHIQQSIEELDDAIQVLKCGGLHPEAIRLLTEAIGLDQRALVATSRPQRNSLLDQARARKTAARNDMVH